MTFIAGMGNIGTAGSGTVTPPIYATTFTTTLTPSGGQPGTSATYLVTPGSGGFNGNPISLSLTGFTAGAVATPAAGDTTPVSVTLAASGAAGTNAIVNSTISGMTNQTGAEQFAVAQSATPPPTPSTSATGYDLVTDQSRVAPGGAITGGLYPRSGLWNGASKTATITAGSGGPSVTVSLPSSGNATVSFSVAAPSAPGMVYVTSTNTAGLRAGAPAPISCFTAGGGSATTISLASPTYIQLPQFGVQPRAWSGAPTGWTGANGFTLNLGWGRLKLPFNSAAPALFARLTDKDSSGATATVNTGTPITAIAQVYGAISGAQTVDIILPASDKCVYLDVASDAAFTNPVRFPVPFFVRDKCLVVTRSQMNMLLGSYANGIPGDQSWSPYVMCSGMGGQNPSGGGMDTNGAYVRIDGVQSYGNFGATFGGVGAQEIGRLHNIKVGTGYTITGETPAGGDLDLFWNQDGSPRSGVASALEYLDYDCRTAIIEGTGWSGVYAPESAAAYKSLFANLSKWLLDHVAALSTIGLCSASGYFGGDGSRATGYTRQNQWIEDLIEAVEPCVVSINASADWNGYYTNSGHANWESAIRYSRASERSILLASPTVSKGFGLGHSDRFVGVAATGTIASGSGQIKIPITFVAGATGVVAKKWNSYAASAVAMAASYSTPTASELACLWKVYQGANGTQDSGAAVVPVSSVTIDGSGNFVLAVPSNTAGPLTVHFLSDFAQLGDGSSWVSYFDNRDPGDGCGYGYGLRSRVDIAVT